MIAMTRTFAKSQPDEALNSFWVKPSDLRTQELLAWDPVAPVRYATLFPVCFWPNFPLPHNITIQNTTGLGSG
jgi:hypothetical protein